MKLRNHLLLWFAIIGLLPLAVVLVFANQYYRSVYLAEVDGEMHEELRRLSTGIDQQFHHQRNLLRALGSTSLMQRFIDELENVIKGGHVTRDYRVAKLQLKRFLLNLEPVVGELAVIRVLDPEGNTVVQVSYGGPSKPELESLLPYPLLEVEVSPAFGAQLANLPDGEIAYLRLPQRAPLQRDLRPPILDAVWPLPLNGQRAYLVYSTTGGRFDRLLALTPRLRDAKIDIIENPSEDATTLRWLFSDQPPLMFSGKRRDDLPIPDAVRRYVAEGGSSAVVRGKHNRWLFTEYLPYPDRLTAWVLSLRLDNAQIGGQFRVIGYGLLALTLVMGLFSILLATLAARRLARPVTQLARNMRNYAHGVPVAGPLRSWSSEVNTLESEFTQMIASLEKAREARKHAERKLVKSARLASIGEMAAGIGHELNNPLTNILSLAKLITRDATRCPEVAEDAEAIIAETRRAAHVVKGILNFSRQIEPVYEQVKVREWIETCARRAEAALEGKGITLLIEADDSLVMMADRYQMEQVLLNLLQNAIYVSPQGGTIRITTQADDGWLRVRVIDHGTGIDPQIKERLFEPFATSKPVGDGSGLGLSISLGIVEMHGGQLQLGDNDAGGCTAEIKIPMVKT